MPEGIRYTLEFRGPRIHGFDGLGVQTIEPGASGTARANQSGAAQHTQVLRNRRLRHAERHAKLDHGAVRGAQQFQECAARRVGNGPENIGTGIYSSQRAPMGRGL